jgi:putative oxidoreductase
MRSHAPAARIALNRDPGRLRPPAGAGDSASFFGEFAMPVIYVIGRILFVAIFLVSGLRKLLDLAGTSRLIETTLWVPPFAAPYVEQVSTVSSMPTPQLAAILLAIIQIAFSLFIIFNVGSRFAALVLALYVAGSTGYFFDFTSFTDLARGESGTLLLKNISMIGGLLVLFALGRWHPGEVVEVEEDYAHETA